MNAKKIYSTAIALTAFFLVTLDAAPTFAYRMIRLPYHPGTYSAGFQVGCNDPQGFAHWDQVTDHWYLNTQLQGSGKVNAMRGALATWTNVRPAGYRLIWGGTTSRGLSGNDRRNVVMWQDEDDTSLLGPNIHAITLLTVTWGQKIVDVDVLCNDSDRNWTTDGTDLDTQSILTHELGHAMGIHHTEKTSATPRPTMFAFYNNGEGTWPRSLTSDDQQALNCAWIRYYPSQAQDTREEAELTTDRGGPERSSSGSGPVAAGGISTERNAKLALSTRPSRAGVLVRLAIPTDRNLKLDVYDVTGRHLVTLLDGRQTAGDHELLWDGTTDRGRAGAGVYFGRVTSADGESAVAKLTFVR